MSDNREHLYQAVGMLVDSEISREKWRFRSLLGTKNRRIRHLETENTQLRERNSYLERVDEEKDAIIEQQRQDKVAQDQVIEGLRMKVEELLAHLEYLTPS